MSRHQTGPFVTHLNSERKSMCLCKIRLVLLLKKKQALVFSAGLGSQQSRVGSKGPFAFLSGESIYCRADSAAPCTRAVVQRRVSQL